MQNSNTGLRLTDALEALNNSKNMLSLLTDLLCHTQDGDVTLSQDGASGLYLLLQGHRDVCQTVYDLGYSEVKSGFGLERAYWTDQSHREYRRGYSEGMRGAQARHSQAAPVPDLTEPVPPHEEATCGHKDQRQSA